MGAPMTDIPENALRARQMYADGVPTSAAFLNTKALNLRELSTEVGFSADYAYGFLIACSSLDFYEGNLSIDEIVVTSLPAERKGLMGLVKATLTKETVQK